MVSQITLEQVAARCEKVRWNGDSFTACCVAHDDRNPSMSVTEKDGIILAHCHAGCPQDAVIAALGIVEEKRLTPLREPYPRPVKRAPDTSATEARAERAVRLSTPAPSNHTYLVTKGIQAHGIGVLGGLYPDLPRMVRRTATVLDDVELPPHIVTLPSGETVEIPRWGTVEVEAPQSVLVIPMQNAHGKLLSCQFIAEDGSKAYMAGPKRKGGFYYIKGNDRLWICEGFATGASLHEDTGDSVACAFDTGGLFPVSDALSALYGRQRDILIMADDDWQTENNPGFTKARQAADATGLKLTRPDFTGFNRGPKDTDFNDLMRLRHG